MPMPFDAVMKELLARQLVDCLPLVSSKTPDRLEVIDTDLSTVTAAADKVLRIWDPDPWLLHLELQSSYNSTLDARIHMFNALLDYRHGPPVHSAVLLLHRRADDRRLSGELQRHRSDGSRYLDFHYQVLRVWQLPLTMLLTGGVGLLPLAPLTDEAVPVLPQVIKQLDERFQREVPSDEVATFWTATAILTGLRYARDIVRQVFQGVRTMRESTYYQLIMDEGRAEGRAEGALQELRKILLRMGTSRYGKPDAATAAAIEAIDDLARLEGLCDRLLQAADWQELLVDDAGTTNSAG